MFRRIFISLTALHLVACGGVGEKKRSFAAPVAQTPGDSNAENNAGNGDLNLILLDPSALSLKIYSAFNAPGLTMTTDSNGDPQDYATTKFASILSSDPNALSPSGVSVSYFLKLATMSSIVGDNYVSKLLDGKARDCRKADDAKAIVDVAVGLLGDADRKDAADKLVAACQKNMKTAVMGLVQSYPFVLKGLQ